jgi:low temperature requirement protein LtrA
VAADVHEPLVTMGTVLRERSTDSPTPVTSMELFFDLVYVFAITQLSEYLGSHLAEHPLRAAVQTLIIFLAVWWAWNYTAWATNYIDPARAPVALLMLVLMAISLVMSAAIPQAFGARGITFAVAYVSIQVARSAFMVVVFGRGSTMGRNYAHLLAWSAIAGVVWIAGALADGDARLLVWAVALALDLSAPMHGFRLPGLGATPMEDWTLAGAHLAERMQLVLLIALGESVLRVGATFAEKTGTLAVDAAFAVGFVITASLWGVYFLRHAEYGADAIGHAASGAARLGRAAYAYAHAIMVAGVIVVAVAIRLTIEDPKADASSAAGATMLIGPAIYLAGLVLFKHSVSRGRSGPPLLGIVVLAALTPLVLFADRLVVEVATAAVLVVLAVAAGVSSEGELERRW